MAKVLVNKNESIIWQRSDSKGTLQVVQNKRTKNFRFRILKNGEIVVSGEPIQNRIDAEKSMNAVWRVMQTILQPGTLYRQHLKTLK